MNKSLKFFILGIILAFSIIAKPTIAQSPILTTTQQDALKRALAFAKVSTTISYFTARYEAPVALNDTLQAVSTCESGQNQLAIGKQGEIGIFQYFKSTWDTMSAAYGKKLDIHSYADQAELTAWVFSEHPEWRNQWTCWRNLQYTKYGSLINLI